MTKYGVFLFHTTSAVMRVEKLLKREGYSTVKLIPTPRQFSSDCGIALQFDWHQYEHIKSMLNQIGVEFNAVHYLNTKEG